MYFRLSLGEMESGERFGDALFDIVEPVLPSVGLGVVDERIGKGGLAVFIGENKRELVLLGSGDTY
jgi:hypothetical protein